jgi:hypothetical protein
MPKNTIRIFSNAIRLLADILIAFLNRIRKQAVLLQ